MNYMKWTNFMYMSIFDVENKQSLKMNALFGSDIRILFKSLIWNYLAQKIIYIYTCMLYKYILFEYIDKIKNNNKKLTVSLWPLTVDCWQCPGVRYSWGTWRWTSPTVNTPSWPRGTRVSTSRPCSAGSTVITRTDAPGRRRNVTSPTENRMWERNNLMHVHNKQFLEMLIFVYFLMIFYAWP